MDFWDVVGGHAGALITSMSTLLAVYLGHWTAQRANRQRADIEHQQWLRGQLLSAASDALTASSDFLGELGRVRSINHRKSELDATWTEGEYKSHLSEAINGANAAHMRLGPGVVKLQLLDTTGGGLASRCVELLNAVDAFRGAWYESSDQGIAHLEKQVLIAKSRLGDEVTNLMSASGI